MLELKKKVDIAFLIIGLITSVLVLLLTNYNWYIIGYFGGFLTSSLILHKDLKNALKEVDDPRADVTIGKVYKNFALNMFIVAIVFTSFMLFTPIYCVWVAAIALMLHRSILLQLIGRLKG